MTALLLYTIKGDVPYYQDGDVIYSKKGEPRFLVSAGRWLDLESGNAKFYVVDCWVTHFRAADILFWLIESMPIEDDLINSFRRRGKCGLLASTLAATGDIGSHQR